MSALVGRFVSGLDHLIDRCVPAELDDDRELKRRARLFLISHFCGPFLGNSIPIYLLFAGFPRDYRLIGFFALVSAFWIAPVTLRKFGHYKLHAFLSVEHLILTILWACFCYGGVHSPFMPWLLTVPLLAFFYLSWSGALRGVLLATIAANLVGFYVLADFNIFPAVDLHSLQVIGLVSTVSAAIYVAMMALYYAKVLKSQVELESEVRQHLATANSLQRAAESAVKASKAKSEFVAKMSHELKQPLNAIIGYSELLIEDAKEEEDESALVDLGNILDAGHQLLALVNDVLDYSKAEAGKIEPMPERIDLPRKLRALMEKHRPAIEERGNTIEILVAPALRDAVVDWLLLDKILSQLVENSARYTSGGTISISCEENPSDRKMLFTVWDTGCGIPSERLPHLFDVFDSADAADASDSNYGGTGLGLPLSRKLARILGGDLVVTSTLNVGSRFTVVLPPSPKAAEPAIDFAGALAA